RILRGTHSSKASNLVRGKNLVTAELICNFCKVCSSKKLEGITVIHNALHLSLRRLRKICTSHTLCDGGQNGLDRSIKIVDHSLLVRSSVKHGRSKTHLRI